MRDHRARCPSRQRHRTQTHWRADSVCGSGGGAWGIERERPPAFSRIAFSVETRGVERVRVSLPRTAVVPRTAVPSPCEMWRVPALALRRRLFPLGFFLLPEGGPGGAIFVLTPRAARTLMPALCCPHVRRPPSLCPGPCRAREPHPGRRCAPPPHSLLASPCADAAWHVGPASGAFVRARHAGARTTPPPVSLLRPV